ncbi:universal stress protein [Nakamurella sp.]|uniref:universal stress protein n=1 Tax=Nakamurella sp. TaxID=1869182 RepID=UPI003B3A1536
MTPRKHPHAVDAAPAVRPGSEPAAPRPAEPGADPGPDGDGSGPPGAVVVGLDGAPGSRPALRWAADEAARRHAPLVLVHAYRRPATGGFPGYNPVPDDLLGGLRDHGREVLRAAAAEMARRHPELTVTRVLRPGRAEVVLRAVSAGARLTVVGHAATSRLTGVLLGSVALAVTSGNPAPVAVVPPGHLPDGPIVVGVDGSPLSEAAVAFAFAEAALRRTELVAVHAWNDPALDARRLEPLLIDPGSLAEQERALLAERLAGWVERYPDVRVRQVLAPRRPVPGLLAYAADAAAVVVGSHGRGGLAGMLLGSTSHALATHARCPVIVVRHPGFGVR